MRHVTYQTLIRAPEKDKARKEHTVLHKVFKVVKEWIPKKVRFEHKQEDTKEQATWLSRGRTFQQKQ